jgi:hypothetical protein
MQRRKCHFLQAAQPKVFSKCVACLEILASVGDVGIAGDRDDAASDDLLASYGAAGTWDAKQRDTGLSLSSNGPVSLLTPPVGTLLFGHNGARRDDTAIPDFYFRN